MEETWEDPNDRLLILLTSFHDLALKVSGGRRNRRQQFGYGEVRVAHAVFGRHLAGIVVTVVYSDAHFARRGDLAEVHQLNDARPVRIVIVTES